MVAVSYSNNLFEQNQIASSPFPAAMRSEKIDLDSFNQLVLDYQDMVYRQAFWITGDEDAAEDATQETFLRAFNHMGSFNGGPFRPWILAIATHYCLDLLRRRKSRKTVSFEVFNEFDEEVGEPYWLKDPDTCVEETVENAESHALVLQAIQKLPEIYRLAVILVDLQDFDYQEAAETLGISLGTFKSRLSRGRQQLRKWLL